MTVKHKWREDRYIIKDGHNRPFLNRLAKLEVELELEAITALPNTSTINRTRHCPISEAHTRSLQ